MPGDNKTTVAEKLDGVSDGGPRGVIDVDEFTLRRERRTWCELSGLDLTAKVVGDLTVDGHAAGPIDHGRHLH